MARNLCPSPDAVIGWGGGGTSGSPASTFTQNVPITAGVMDGNTAAYLTQSGLSGNARVTSAKKTFDADAGGQWLSGTIQGWPEPPPTRYTNDPVCATDTTGWRTAGGSGTRVTGLAGMVATTGYRVTASATGAVGIGCQIIAVTVGENLTGTVQARPSVATNLTWYLSFYDSAGVLVSRITGPVVAAAAGAAITRAVGGVAPAGAVTASVTIYTDVVAAGSTLTATGARIDGVADSAMEYARTLSCAAELVFRSSTGSQLATVTGAAATVATGGPVRVWSAGQAPSGTRTVEITFLARAAGARSKVWATAARLDQVNDPALAYADGDTPGWIWEGAAGLSASCDGWRADTDSSTSATDALQIGYVGTQRQTNNEPITNGGDPIPVVAAPFGRLGRALQIVASAPPWQRLESNPNHVQFGSGEDWWFGFAFALGAGFPTWVDDYMVIDQLHGAPSTGSPPISFETRQYSLRLRGGDNRPKSDAGDNYGSAYAYNLPLLQNLRVNRWYAVVYHLITSDQLGGGSLDVWVDGVQRLAGFAPPPGSVYGTTEFPSTGGKTYRKQGLYKRPALPGGTVWHAGAALGRSYAAVDPTRSQLVATSESMAPVAA